MITATAFKTLNNIYLLNYRNPIIFLEKLTTYVSIHYDCIKSVEAEPIRYLIWIENDPVKTAALLNPGP